MKIKNLASCLVLAATICYLPTFVSCNVDRLYTIEFNIDNQHDKPVKVGMKGYAARNGQKDTTFTISPGTVSLVYMADGLGLMEESYIQSGKLIFCDSISLSSDDATSSRNLRLSSEWEHEHKNSYDERYRLKIVSEDFKSSQQP